MDVVHERAAGIDISKRDAKVAVRVPGKRAGTFTTSVTTWGATTSQVLELIEFLVSARVTTVVMEATSDYWKPFYYLMEDALPVMLVNAKQARNIPGRKTDVSDAAWLAQLASHGLLRASLVPPEPVRQLRDLTRARTIATRGRSRVAQRLEKFLESSGIKLSAVVSELTGVSGRLMLEALVDGERDPVVLADLAKRGLRKKIPQLEDALLGRFTEHHAFMVRQYLTQIDQQTTMIDRLTERIEEAIAPFRSAREVLVTPGRLGPRRRCHHRRDRRRNDHVRNRRAPRVLGRSLPRAERVRREDEVLAHHAREPLPQRRARRRGDVRVPVKGNFPRRPLPAVGHSPRQAPRARRDRAHHPHRRLAHAPKRRGLRRTRCRFLHPTRPSTHSCPRHPRPRIPRLRRGDHPSRRLTSRSTLVLERPGVILQDSTPGRSSIRTLSA